MFSGTGRVFVRGFRDAGFRVRGARFGVVKVQGFGFWVTRFRVVEVRRFGYGVSGSLFRVSGTGCTVRGLGGSGFRVGGFRGWGFRGSGFWVRGFAVRGFGG